MIDWEKVKERLKEHTSDSFTLKEMLDYLYCGKGLSLNQIADLTRGECCGDSIGSKMEEYKFKLRSRGGSRNVRPVVITQGDYMSMTYKQLMKKYGLSYTTVYKRTKGYKRKLPRKTKVSAASP